MELTDVINKRKSVRKYKQDHLVGSSVIDKLAETARKCPSAGAVRGYHYIVTHKQIIGQIQCPTFVVICTDPEKYAKRYGSRGRDLYSVQDAAIFASYLQLLITEYGFETVWIGAFIEKRIKCRMKLPDNLRPVAILAVGVKDDT